MRKRNRKNLNLIAVLNETMWCSSMKELLRILARWKKIQRVVSTKEFLMNKRKGNVLFFSHLKFKWV